MKENLRDITEALLKWITLAVIFITPLLFSPWTFDFFEFPKQVFLWIAAALLLVLWLLRFVLDGEVKLLRTPIDLPLLLFLAVATISTVLSSSRYTSLVGFFGRADGGLAGWIALVIVFYAGTASMRSIKDVLHGVSAFLISSGLLAILAIFYYFGLHIFPWNAAKVATFSPAGGMFALTVCLSLAIPVALATLMYLRGKQATPATAPAAVGTPAEKSALSGLAPFYGALLAVATVFYVAAIALLANPAAWAGIIVGVAILFLWSKRGHVKAASPFILAIIVASVFWIALTNIPAVRKAIPGLNQNASKPPVLDAAESWYVAGSTMRDLPFLGSGPATYLFDFTRYRSQRYNATDNWNLRFVVAHDQYLQILTTMGVVGFAMYLFLLLRLAMFGFRNVLRSREGEYYPLKVGVFAAIVAFMAATLFVTATTAILTAFFGLAILLMALEKISGSNAVAERKFSFVLATHGGAMNAKPTNAVPILLFIPGLLIGAAVFFATAQYVRANVAYVKGVQTLASGKPDSAAKGLDLQQQAVRINPWEDAYHRDLARTAFNLALAVSQKQDLTDQDRQTIADLLRVSISQAQRSASLSPLNVNNWQTLADIYRRIAGQVQGAGDVALQAFAQAIRIDPANPQQFLDVGGIFYAANAYDRAIDAFKQAAALKPNLANAHYNLANAYVKKGEYNNAYIEYLAVKQILGQLPDSDANKKDSIDKLDQEMAAIKDKVQVAGAATNSAQPQGGTQQASPAPSASAAPAGSAAPSASARPTATPLLRNITPAPSAAASAAPAASPAAR